MSRVLRGWHVRLMLNVRFLRLLQGSGTIQGPKCVRKKQQQQGRLWILVPSLCLSELLLQEPGEGLLRGAGSQRPPGRAPKTGQQDSIV